MKALLIALVALVFLSNCSNDNGKPCVKKGIPAYNRAAASKYVENLMATIKVQSRNDN